MTMSKSPRALQELMTAVDAGHAVDRSASSGSKLLVGPRSRRSATYGGRGGARKRAPAAVVVEASSDTSFEFSAVVSYSSASPASMVFSEGQLRAHQFPAVRSSAGSSQAASPVRRRSSSVGSYGTNTKQQAGVAAARSKKRVSFATDGMDKAAAAKAGGAAGQGKKSGGLLGCMASACGSNEAAVEPAAARNANNRKVGRFDQ